MEKAIFRRLAEQDIARFEPWYKWSVAKIGWAIALSAVCVRWVIR